VLRYTARRLLGTIPVLLGLSIVLFIVVHLLPGDPTRAILGEHATPDMIARLRASLGLDRPLWEQYLLYLGQLSRGDLGVSLINGASVGSEFLSRFPATVELTVAALFLAVGIGVPLGQLAARHAHQAPDALVTLISLTGISIPVFVLGLTLQYIFGAQLHVLPTGGRIDPRIDFEPATGLYIVDSLAAGNGEAFVDVLRHLILPAIALGSIPLAVIARITRASALEVLNEDYVRTARAKGLSERRINRRHVMRNAWLPVVTVIGLEVGSLLAGAVITETVFAWNGVGRWVVQAIHDRDYFVVQSSVLIFAVVFVLVNLVVDLSYAVLNPRVRVG